MQIKSPRLIEKTFLFADLLFYVIARILFVMGAGDEIFHLVVLAGGAATVLSIFILPLIENKIDLRIFRNGLKIGTGFFVLFWLPFEIKHLKTAIAEMITLVPFFGFMRLLFMRFIYWSFKYGKM